MGEVDIYKGWYGIISAGQVIFPSYIPSPDMAPLTTLFALAASVASGVIAIPHPRSLTPRTHYAPARINANWKHVGGAIASENIEFTFVLAGDYEGLTARMEKTASERSAWLTRDELKTYVAPSNEAKAAVQAAIEELGATRVATSPAGDKVTVSTTVERASQVRVLFLLLSHSSRRDMINE